MTQLEATEAVFARFIEMWPTLSGGVPFSTENNVVPEAETQAVIEIESFPSAQYTIGRRARRKYLHSGVIRVRLTGPLNVGRGPLDVLVEHVRAIFQGQRFGAPSTSAGVVTYASSPREQKRDRDATQLRIVEVTTPFEFFGN